MGVIPDAIRSLGQYDPERMIQREPDRATQSQGVGICAADFMAPASCLSFVLSQCSSCYSAD
jgi:hypothetical protein